MKKYERAILRAHINNNHNDINIIICMSQDFFQILIADFID